MSTQNTATLAPGRTFALYFTLALVAASFSATGPVAIIISAAQQAGLSGHQTSSWIFSALAVNGLASLLISWKTRQPLVFLWTIPGTVLAAPVIAHYGLGAAIGVYLACAAVLVLLALTNAIALLDKWVPMPIVMAMIAGLFMRYAIAIVTQSVAAPVLGAAMVLAFFGLLWMNQFRNLWLPPIIGAAVAGAVALALTGFHWPSSSIDSWFATPQLSAPVWNGRAMSELLVPMLVTILFVQNAQGIAVGRSAGYPVSTRLVTYSSAILTCLTAPFGGCPSVLAGPCNAVLVSDGPSGRHWIGAVTASALFVGIGLLSSAYASLLTSLPMAFTAILAGLSMLGVIQKSLVSAFRSEVSLSALATLVVTLSDVTVFGIGSAFWGIVIGCVLALRVK